MGQRHASSFNNYTVLQRKADPPTESWWVCPPDEFSVRWKQEVLRMQLHPINRTIAPPVLGGKLP